MVPHSKLVLIGFLYLGVRVGFSIPSRCKTKKNALRTKEDVESLELVSDSHPIDFLNFGDCGF